MSVYDELSERNETECRIDEKTGDREEAANVQHCVAKEQHEIIFTYLINGCRQIFVGGGSDLKVLKNKKEKK